MGMKFQTPSFIVLLLLHFSIIGSSNGGSDTKSVQPTYMINAFNRSSFPPDFLFGAASSAYQFEGATHEDGRGPSIWDTFIHKYPEKILDRSNADVALDSYHRYKEDVQVLKRAGLNAYRFSIAWPRILPHGKLSKGVNQKGLAYYHNLIDELLANGITPFVTLFHWDLPQALEDEYGGFLSPSIVDDFRDYSDICFKEFGDKVKYWITLNEPWSYSTYGYATGGFAPGRCSKWQQLNCTGGDSSTEPYLVTHNLLLAHAASVDLYRRKYQASQKGVIGITLVTHWFVPFSNVQHNVFAAERSLDFMFGWYMDPISKGDYPHTMRSLVKSRLPQFSKQQIKMLKGSFDFLGLNYYTGLYASYDSSLKHSKPSYLTDSISKETGERFGKPIGPKTGFDLMHVYPKGLRDLLNHIKTKYNNPVVYITENGMPEADGGKLSVTQALNDQMRVQFYHGHLVSLSQAIKEGSNVKGFILWSLLDNFEWNSGYTLRFGINYVDFKNGLKRYPKLSAKWFKNFLETRK